MEVRKLVETNIYIFKENIKVLLSSIVDQLWAKNVLKDNLDQMIIKETNRSVVDEIVEVEDDNCNTESLSQSVTNLVR